MGAKQGVVRAALARGMICVNEGTWAVVCASFGLFEALWRESMVCSLAVGNEGVLNAEGGLGAENIVSY